MNDETKAAIEFTLKVVVFWTAVVTIVFYFYLH